MSDEQGYKAARGAFEWQEGDEPAEATVRRMRDGEAPPAQPDALEQAREAWNEAVQDISQAKSWQSAAAMRDTAYGKAKRYITALEAHAAAQQQRIDELERLNHQANGLLGSCWSMLQHVLSGHFPRPEIERMVDELEAWNVARHDALRGKGE